MRRIAFVSTLAALAVALMLTAAPIPREVAQAQEAPQAQRDSVALTIYNQGTALVQDRRTFDLPSSTVTLDFTDVAAGIDPTSVKFVSLTDPDGTIVLEQNYIFDLVDSGALLQRYLDQTIVVITDDGTEYRGQLLSGRGGEIILRTEDGQVIVIQVAQIRDLRFPDLPGGLITRPTLRWLLQVANPGAQQVELTYLTSGLNWTADYTVLLAADNAALDLNGWVTLSNTSGAAFTDAQVKLVAGDVNRLPDARAMEMMPMAADALAVPAPTQGVAQREFYEYNLYEINRPVTVGLNETKQVEFVSGAGIPANSYYVYNGSFPYYGGGPIADQYYGQTGVTDVMNYLEFSTGEDSGLGADLPAGRIRVYQEDVDGAALLIGENTIDHTPMGEPVDIYLGNAFDLVGERIQTSFNRIADTVIEESYEIRLRNRKGDQAVEIRVPEVLFRWTNWEIVSTSMEFTQLDANTIEFRAQVPPGGETIITYTVRYSW